MSWLGAMYVMIGGSFGALCRYLLGNGIGHFYSGDFPLPNMVINIVGSCLLGMWIAYVAYTLPERARELHLLIAIGVLGGFTTFSSFTADLFVITQREDITRAAVDMVLYVGGSVVLSLVGMLAGMRIIRHIFS